MWSYLKSDYSYVRNAVIFGIVIVFSVTLFEIWRSQFTNIEEIPIIRSISPNYLKFWMIFIIPQMWNSYRNKENRIRQIATVPLSLNSFAIHRLLAIIVPMVIFCTFSAIILIIAQKAAILSLSSYALMMGALLLMFSLYFISRDLTISFLRRLGMTRQKAILLLSLMVLGINFLGLTVLMVFNAKSGPAKAVGHFFDWVIAHYPFSGEYGNYKLFLVSLLFAGISILTFRNRKSYLE